MKISWLLVLLFLLKTEEGRGEEKGGLRLQISQQGLQYAASVAVDTLLINLHQDSIEDHNGTKGKLTYELKNIKFEEFSRPDVTAALDEEEQHIVWRLSNCNIKTSLDWKYRFKQNRYLDFRDDGSVVIEAEGLSVEVVLKVAREEESGRPVIETTRCESDLDDLKINFGARASWLYEAIVEIVREPLKELLADEICRAAKRALNRNANGELRTLEIATRLSEGVMFDFKLVSTPRISNSCVQSHHTACIHRVGHYDCPSNHPVMEMGPEGRMLALSLSEQSLNSWAKSAFWRGDLNETIRSTHLEEEHQHYFDTDCSSGFCLVSFLPTVKRDFPHSKLEADFITLEPPILRISNSNFNGHIEAIVKMFVRTPNDERTELFTVRVNSSVDLSTEMNNNILKFRLTDYHPNLEIISIKVSDAPEHGLMFASRAAGKTLVNKVNIRGEQGIPLIKMRDLHFTNSELSFQEGYLHLVTDVRYERPEQ